MPESELESWLGLEFSGFSIWHFLKLVVRVFSQVLWSPTLLHWVVVSAMVCGWNKCDLISIKLNSWAVPLYHMGNMLHVIGAWCVCVWFAHDCVLATWAYVLETVRSAMRGQWKFLDCAFQYCCYYDDDAQCLCMWFAHGFADFVLAIWVYVLETIHSTSKNGKKSWTVPSNVVVVAVAVVVWWW